MSLDSGENQTRSDFKSRYYTPHCPAFRTQAQVQAAWDGSTTPDAARGNEHFPLGLPVRAAGDQDLPQRRAVLLRPCRGGADRDLRARTDLVGGTIARAARGKGSLPFWRSQDDRAMMALHQRDRKAVEARNELGRDPLGLAAVVADIHCSEALEIFSEQ